MTLDPKTLQPGEHQQEQFKSRDKTFVQYDYRHFNGVLFSCVRPTLAECIDAREAWIASKQRGEWEAAPEPPACGCDGRGCVSCEPGRFFGGPLTDPRLL